MQFRDLSKQYKILKKQIDISIQEAIDSSRFIQGKQVKALEKKLAEYVGVKHCITCANGTDALILTLKAWGIGAGDAVFAPDFTFFATVNSVMLNNATPVLVDIDKKTFNVSPEALEQVIVETIKKGKLKPKAIIPVDLFGQCADYQAIERIAQKYDMKILEDGAQGFGGSINSMQACSFGDAATTSFFPAKPLGCYGDGGAIFTDDDGLEVVLRSICAQGRSPEDKYDNRDIGMNSRLDTLQAAILLPKFKAFVDYEIENVNKVAVKYTQLLQDVVTTPYVAEGYISSWAQYTILLETREHRDKLQSYLKQHDIPTMVYYPRGMHQQTAIKKYGYDKGSFPITEKIVDTCLALPMHPYMEENDILIVAERIKDFISSKS